MAGVATAAWPVTELAEQDQALEVEARFRQQLFAFAGGESDARAVAELLRVQQSLRVQVEQTWRGLRLRPVGSSRHLILLQTCGLPNEHDLASGSQADEANVPSGDVWPRLQECSKIGWFGQSHGMALA
jgi:hypothetical protein